MTKVGGIRKLLVLLQAVFLAASPLVTAPPSNLTRLYYDGSAAKSHSTTTQYRQLRRLEMIWVCHNRKQTERSYQIFIHIAGWWRNTFFALFYFSLPVISQISVCGRTFWHGTTAPTTRRLTTDKAIDQAGGKRPSKSPASTSCKVTYWPITTRARVLEGHFFGPLLQFSPW